MVQDVAPFKVGFLNEGIADDPETFERTFGNIIRFRFDEALEAGEVDRPIELVVRSGRGLPRGTAQAVCDAWTELADAGVLLIIGPGITDNCIAVTPLFEQRRIPTINFPGTTHSRGRYGFHYQIGALYGDGPLIARAMTRRHLGSVAVIRDRSPIGAEFFEYFEGECERSGLAISQDIKCSPVSEDLYDHAQEAARANPDALVYLGFGGVLLDLSRALKRVGWDPPRFTTSAGMHFYSKSPEEKREMSGWVYVDQVDEDNVTLREMLDRLREAHRDSAIRSIRRRDVRHGNPSRARYPLRDGPHGRRRDRGPGTYPPGPRCARRGGNRPRFRAVGADRAQRA
jgi:ABC-type branched-subunit amino acid transport system substrate-binding protein